MAPVWAVCVIVGLQSSGAGAICGTSICPGVKSSSVGSSVYRLFQAKIESNCDAGSPSQCVRPYGTVGQTAYRSAKTIVLLSPSVIDLELGMREGAGLLKLRIVADDVSIGMPPMMERLDVRHVVAAAPRRPVVSSTTTLPGSALVSDGQM